MRQIISKICTIIAILFIFPLMFKTNMCHITLALRRFKLSLIVKRCQGRVVISLFSNIHVYRFPYWPETESRANMGRGMITRPIWKCPCIKLFITYFRHLEKRHPYWPETKSRSILARASLLPVILVIQKCLYLN
jgi:hypothetical protein